MGAGGCPSTPREGVRAAATKKSAPLLKMPPPRLTERGLLDPEGRLFRVSTLAEIRGGRLRDISPEALEAALLDGFRGVGPESAGFLGGESMGQLFDRVLPAIQRLTDARDWDCALAVLHGGVNRAWLNWALTGARTFLGHVEQAPGCINVLDVGEGWVVRTINLRLWDPLSLDGRETTMERLYQELRGIPR